MGQRFAPRAFGSKKCVVLAVVVRPDTHSRFSFSSAEASRNLGFLRGRGICKQLVQEIASASVNNIYRLLLRPSHSILSRHRDCVLQFLQFKPQTSSVLFRSRWKRKMTMKPTFLAFHNSTETIYPPPGC